MGLIFVQGVPAANRILRGEIWETNPQLDPGYPYPPRV